MGGGSQRGRKRDHQVQRSDFKETPHFPKGVGVGESSMWLSGVAGGGVGVGARKGSGGIQRR